MEMHEEKLKKWSVDRRLVFFKRM